MKEKNVMFKIIGSILVGLVVSAIVTGIYVGIRNDDGREFERQQPVLMTNQGIFTCRYGHVGVTITSDFKCEEYVLSYPLPEGVMPSVELPEGTKKITF